MLRKKSLALLSLFLLTACGGGGADTRVNTVAVSKGQELIDLKKAEDQGVITPSEYETQKERILDRE